MDSEKERVVFVEFNSDGTPWEVITQEHCYGYVRGHDYDFAVSKRYGLLFHESGSGPASAIKVYQSFQNDTPVTSSYWAPPDVGVEEVGTCIRLEALPDEYTPEKLFDGIECAGQMVWCSVCEDWTPDNCMDFCEHVWYCLDCNETSTPDERCECKEDEE